MSFNYGLRPTKTQKISSSGSSSAVANVFGTQTEYVRIATTHSCHYVIGGNASSAPTATTSDAYLHAGDYEIIKVSPGEKIAAIRNTSTSGDLFVTEMSA